MTNQPNNLGAKLREIRDGKGLSIRELSRQSELASGYISQLERGEVTQPTPSTLKRLADAYGMPVMTLMQWAGYEVSQAPTSPQLARAMSVIGSDPSSGEIDAIEAVLKVLRGRAGFSQMHLNDRQLSPQDRNVIRAYAVALLRDAGALERFPTDLDALMDFAKLVHAGEIKLTSEEHKGLLKRFGNRLQWALTQVQGLITFSSNEIWLAPDLHPNRRRFVHAHEIGHHILPVHRDLAYLDNWQTMSPDLRDVCEREANEAAIELLAQGDKLRVIADDSRFGTETVATLSGAADISLQATARRLAEDSKRLCATVIYYKGGGRLMPPHIYPSVTFEDRFRWLAIGPPSLHLRESIRSAVVTGVSQELICDDQRGRTIPVRCEAIDTPRALIGLVAKDPGGPLAKVFPASGIIKVRSAA